VRWSLGRLPARVRSFNDGPQWLESLEPPGHLDTHPRGADREGLDRGNRPDRQQLHKGPPLCWWRKRGARANAIGISRGGRTTKIHALVDVLGRPLRLVPTAGNTSDVKGADMLIGETIGMRSG